MHILHIVGARPNFIKAAPVIQALSAHLVQQTLVHTGQHFDALMSDVFFDEQPVHCESASPHVATGHVPHGVANA